MKIENFVKRINKEINPEFSLPNLESDLAKLQEICNNNGYTLKMGNKSSSLNQWYQVSVFNKSKELYGVGFYYGYGENRGKLQSSTVQNWQNGGRFEFPGNQMENSITHLINLINQ